MKEPLEKVENWLKTGIAKISRDLGSSLVVICNAEVQVYTWSKLVCEVFFKVPTGS